MTTDQIIQEIYPEIDKDVFEKVKEYMEELKNGANFFIIPKKKSIEKEPGIIKRTCYRCIAVKGNMKDEIIIDTDRLYDTQNFEKALLKYVGLEATGFDVIKKGKNETIIKDLKKRLRLLKRFFDYCSISKLLDVQEQVSQLGYNRENSNEIRFINGILDINNGVFEPRNFVIKNPNKIEYLTGDDVSIQESLDGLGSLPKRIFKNDNHIFIFGGFFAASIWANEIFEYYQNFPQFYIFGARGTGKSFATRIPMKIVGFTKAETIDLSKITTFTLIDQINNLKRYVFAEEYSCVHNNKNFVNNILRGNYDRTFSSRGRPGGKTDNSGPYSMHYANDSVIFCAGETLPNDEALLTRMVVIEADNGFTHEINNEEYGKIISEYRNIFFNVVRHKNEISVISYIEKAKEIISKTSVPIKEQRIRNNLTIIIAGNLLIGNTDEEWLLENVYNYLKNYDRLFNINTTTYDIIDDVVNFPDEYLSLYRVIEKQEKYPIFIYNNYLIIGMRSLINKYQYRHKERGIDKPKIENELKNLLGIRGKVDSNLFNYIDFIGKRPKGLAIPYEQVKKNTHTTKLRNTFIDKLELDRYNNCPACGEDTIQRIDECLTNYKEIDEEDGDSEKDEK